MKDLLHTHGNRVVTLRTLLPCWERLATYPEFIGKRPY
jgi:hypothetical protein